MPRAHSPEEKSALIAGIAAFLTWGLVPVYWKLLQVVPAQEILAHRFSWTWLFMVLLLSWSRRWREVFAALRSARTAIFCCASGFTIALNWFVFIWAVNDGRVLATSLGYFMTPLVNILLGAIFLRERLSRAQLLAVLLAVGAVVYLTIDLGSAPWVALFLCVSFGFYGLFRKVSGAGATAGLFLETTVILPLAVIYLCLLGTEGRLRFGLTNIGLSGLLISTGIVTGVPLLWFAHAARHLRLTTLGFLQYLAPSCTFLLGAFLYHEPLRHAQLIGFALIWIALAVFTFDALKQHRATLALQPVEM